ncbi:hypothetical protein ACQW02_04430 [Humitalea sp. 24SJ18S-53]|uniref:hypothetical protein n=1 Tax=Humitalea sp. 24SJ18S-53 TaxID=3422307 RepID=UPI003D67177A
MPSHHDPAAAMSPPIMPRRRARAPRGKPAETDMHVAFAVMAAAEVLDSMLSVATGLVKGGRQVDLAGLEQDAARLCAAALGCPVATQPMLRAALLPLVPRLDALRAAITPD